MEWSQSRLSRRDSPQPDQTPGAAAEAGLTKWNAMEWNEDVAGLAALKLATGASARSLLPASFVGWGPMVSCFANALFLLRNDDGGGIFK